MEYVIAIFVGLWISAAGLFSYRRICRDFSETDDSMKKGDY